MDRDDGFERWFKFLAAAVVSFIVVLVIALVVIAIHFLAKVW